MSTRLEGLGPEQFEVFTIQDFQPCMEALVTRVRPRLEALGAELRARMSERLGETLHLHVARHARRTVNPPRDTWLALSPDARGYKAHPHFQLGLWGTHVFAQFALIYEAPSRPDVAGRLLERPEAGVGVMAPELRWSGDHTRPGGVSQSDAEGVRQLLVRARDLRKAEVLCGRDLDRDDPRVPDGEALVAWTLETWVETLPLWALARSVEFARAAR
jgi:uncharacterized protein YktB (UPF0637 family)